MKRSKLHIKLAKHAALLALLIGLLISGSQVFFDLRNERNRIDNHISEIINSAETAATEAAYELDLIYAQTIADGLIVYESIANVSIYDDRQNLLAYSGFPIDYTATDWISSFIIREHSYRFLPLIRNSTGPAVGTISIEVNADKLSSDFISRAKAIFISGFIRSMAMVIIFLILFYFVLTRPLLKTIGEISNLDQSDHLSDVSFGASLTKRDDELGTLVVMFRDLLTNRKIAEERLKHIAFHDVLTNLPNRLLLMDRLEQSIKRAKRNKRRGAVFFMDLDNFKNVNDSLGHPVGDRLIHQVGNRLVAEFREEDTVGRLGGDEFLVLLPDLGVNQQQAELKAHELAKKIRGCFNSPFIVDGQELFVKPSIGISFFPDPNINVNELMKQADTAMYEAKADGGDTFRFYHQDMLDQVNKRVTVEKELRDALMHENLLLHYQPQINDDGTMMGIEVLVRWNHPVKGMIPPDEFIYIAEASGLIAPMGIWIIRKACEDFIELGKTVLPADCRLSLNVSVRQFAEDDFVQEIQNIIFRTGVNPKLITLEVTESIMIGKIEDSLSKMLELQKMGLEFSIDDFGTGYSSLQYLKELPFTELKIDRSFVKSIELQESEAEIVITIIAMAKSLKMRVVAEGVETKEQHKFLLDNGCNIYQGYLFSRPLPLDLLIESQLIEPPLIESKIET